MSGSFSSRPCGGPLALLAMALALGVAADASAAGRRWQVAPAGACAEAERRDPCRGGACASSAPARSRFDPTDVAAGGRGGAPPPSAEQFAGPGSCADPSTPCGSSGAVRIAETPPMAPSPAAPSPASPPGGALPSPPAPPAAPPAPTPPTVVESPAGPGTLPGLP
jgi:hypothetical protein